MKELRLIKLELTNYRNIEHEVFVFNGTNSKIVGENRIGKTNTLEAIYFLLTNYLLDGSSDLANLKPLNDTKKVVSVEGTFELFDTTKPQEPPMTITLTKTYGEKWTKKRGVEEVVFEGHFENYFVNGIQQSREKDYHELLVNYLGVRNDQKDDVDPIQMLCNPLYLGNMGEGKDWTKLRTYIVKLIGDVGDEEIFTKAPTTRILLQDLALAFGRVDQLTKKYKNERDATSTQLVGLDSQVELLEKTSCPTEVEIKTAENEIKNIDSDIDSLKANKNESAVTIQFEKEIFELDRKIVDQRQVEYKEYMAHGKSEEEIKHDNDLAQVNKDINDLTSQSSQLAYKIGIVESHIRAKETIRTQLGNEYKDITKKISEVDSQVESVCPTCKRPLEKDQVEKRKQELLTELNARKEKVAIEGKTNTEVLNSEKAELETLLKEKEGIKEQLSKLNTRYQELMAQTFTHAEYQESKELVALREQKAKLSEQLTKAKESESQGATSLYEKISELELKKAPFKKVLEDKNFYDRQMQILASVKEQRKSVSQTLVQVEQKQEALKLYTYTRLRLLDDHVKKVFGNIKFQLIKENINGGFDPICKPYIYDIDKQESTEVLWKSGSKSEKIITGIAIVEAIRKELGSTELPFLFDEGGEISTETLRTKFRTHAQIICVRVEDNIVKPVVVNF